MIGWISFASGRRQVLNGSWAEVRWACCDLEWCMIDKLNSEPKSYGVIVKSIIAFIYLFINTPVRTVPFRGYYCSSSNARRVDCIITMQILMCVKLILENCQNLTSIKILESLHNELIMYYTLMMSLFSFYFPRLSFTYPLHHPLSLLEIFVCIENSMK